MEVGIRHSRFVWVVLTFAMLVLPCARALAGEATLEELKQRLANAGLADRPPLCIRISEQQLGAAHRLYLAGDSDKAQAALIDVTAFSELASNYAVQSHKHEKQSEIAIRKMIRKLESLKHAVTHDDQKPIQDSIERLQKIRDDLLAAMFPQGVKK